MTDLFIEGKKLKFCSADNDYGDVSGCAELDMDEEEFDTRKLEILSSLELSEEQRAELERNSRGQSHSTLWKEERWKRLTASSFGKVCKMRRNTSCVKTVQYLLYNTFGGNAATRFGMEKKHLAIQELEVILNEAVDMCGLFVDSKMPFLAVTPDGVIGQDSVVEVKCPAKAKHLTPVEATEKKIITYCTIINDTSLKLKTTHNFYYQVQGQLHITQRRNCFFVVWTPHGISIEKIDRDDDFWREKMEAKLSQFYLKCILPEIVDPRHPRKLPIRETEIGDL